MERKEYEEEDIEDRLVATECLFDTPKPFNIINHIITHLDTQKVMFSIQSHQQQRPTTARI